MEKLIAYLSDTKVPRWVFAQRIGVNPSSFSLILSGNRKLTAAEAVKIEDCTGGKVTVRDLV